MTTSPGACTSSASTVCIRLNKLFFCAGVCSGSAAAGGGPTFSPVHSRKPPQDPQNESLSAFWNPH
ncbi:MAG TPA: hypothetical protein VNC22_11140 [Sporichthya sp.]|nr:hypothetical protein [Sporichthya sp.]